MISRFFRLALSLIVLGSSVFAAPAGATPAPTEKKKKEGYIRFWNMLPRGKGELRLIKNDGTADGTAILTAEPLNYYAGYEPLPTGRYSLKVVHSSDPKTAIKNFDVILNENVFVTFVAKPNANSINVEMVDDTYDRSTVNSGRLVIHQQFPNANVIVTSSAQLRSETLGYGTVQTIEGFPLKIVTFNLQATLSNGKRRSWSTEVDFRASRHASLIIMPDMYDRFRVRLSADGQIEGN